MPPKPHFYLIDGYSMAFRHYHAMKNQALTTPNGEPIGAVIGFTRQIMDIILKDKPEYLAVAFDRGLSGREVLYPQYKAHRDDPPEDFEPQVTWIWKMLEAFNVPHLALDGYEADDIIGTIARQADGKGVQTRIISGDGDMLQLLTANTEVYLFRPFGAAKLYDEAAFHEKYGLQPPQLVDLKSLQGDTSDNIPGVPGIGEKGAAELIKQFGSLQAVYDQLDQVSKPALRKKLESGRDSAFMSLKLATIITDLNIDLTLEDCRAEHFDPNAVMAFFDEVGFRTMRQQFQTAIYGETAASTMPQDSGEQMAMFPVEDISADEVAAGAFSDPSAFAAPEGGAAKAGSLIKPYVVRSENGLAQVATMLQQAKQIAFDTETTGIDAMRVDLVGISLAVDGENGYYIPVGHVDDTADQLPIATVIEALRPSMTDPNIPKVAHNAAYDLLILGRYGLEVTPVTFDTMIAEWMRDNRSNDLGLDRLALRPKLISEKGVRMQQITELIGKGKNQITMAAVPVSKAAPYAAEDAGITWRLVEPLYTALQAHPDSWTIFQTLEMTLVPVLVAMRAAGVLINSAQLNTLSTRLEGELKKIEEDIFANSGGYGSFNINSPRQLNDVLFGKLGLPRTGLKKTVHGYSTASDVLERLYEDTGHPILQKIMEQRELTKLKGTYVDALPQLVNPYTGRLHTDFNQTIASTGRLSSSNPNLQNIPVRTEVGREVRHAFIAPDGYRLLSVDYSQVELRIMAHMADEPYLKRAFADGQDIHAATAAIVNGVTLDQVTYAMRSFAKRVNFGLLYGMGAFRLSRDSEMTMAEADRFIKTYFQQLPQVERYIKETKAKMHADNYVETLFGRRRYFASATNAVESARMEREAINMPIQGTAADIMKVAMINVYQWLLARQNGARILLQVHDELLLEVPEDHVEETAQQVVSIMENAYPLDPALKAEARVGQNWRDLTPM
ncbi:MAG: DNA polymerase I [Phototrophicaceae bacterium]|jgi:DNA polymerase-1